MAATVYYYAYVNEQDIVEQIFDMPAPITSPQYISILSHDETLIGKRYNRTTGEFEEVIDYVQVTADEKRRWDQRPVANFRFTKSEKITNTGEKTYTIPFDTGKPGYMPRKVVIQCNGKKGAGFGEALALVDSTTIVMERDEDNTRRLYIASANHLGDRAAGYVSNPLSDEIFYWKKDADGECAYVGGQAFLNKATSAGGKYMYIGRFTFDENSTSFTIQLPPEYTAVYAAISLKGWVY